MFNDKKNYSESADICKENESVLLPVNSQSLIDEIANSGELEDCVGTNGEREKRRYHWWRIGPMVNDDGLFETVYELEDERRTLSEANNSFSFCLASNHHFKKLSKVKCSKHESFMCLKAAKQLQRGNFISVQISAPIVALLVVILLWIFIRTKMNVVKEETLRVNTGELVTNTDHVYELPIQFHSQVELIRPDNIDDVINDVYDEIQSPGATVTKRNSGGLFGNTYCSMEGNTQTNEDFSEEFSEDFNVYDEMQSSSTSTANRNSENIFGNTYCSMNGNVHTVKEFCDDLSEAPNEDFSEATYATVDDVVYMNVKQKYERQRLD